MKDVAGSSRLARRCKASAASALATEWNPELLFTQAILRERRLEAAANMAADRDLKHLGEAQADHRVP